MPSPASRPLPDRGRAPDPPRPRVPILQVYSECPSYDRVVPALLERGVWGLQEVCKFTPGVPVKPMLAKPTTGVLEVLAKFEGEEFTCEYKYDGERAQVHLLEDGTVRGRGRRGCLVWDLQSRASWSLCVWWLQWVTGRGGVPECACMPGLGVVSLGGPRRCLPHPLPRPAPGQVKIYSRNSEDNTSKYPDLVALMPQVPRPLPRTAKPYHIADRTSLS